MKMISNIIFNEIDEATCMFTGDVEFTNEHITLVTDFRHNKVKIYTIPYTEDFTLDTENVNFITLDSLKLNGDDKYFEIISLLNNIYDTKFVDKGNLLVDDTKLSRLYIC